MQKNKLKYYMPYEYSRNSYDGSSFYKSMFVEDIKNGIIPIRLNGDEDTIKITIDADEKDLKLMKSILSSFNEYSETYNIEKLVKYAIKGIARDILWHGDAIYEIHEEHENDEKQIKFINLIAEKFVDLKFFYIQIPPQKSLPYKFVNKKLLWKISIPKELQKKYSYKRILSSIDKFDSSMPKTFKDDLYNGNNNYYNYDSKEYRKKQFLYVNELTSEWGWNQRNTSGEYTTEFFGNYKYLKFKLSKAIFREHIINELNTLFKKLDLKASINTEGALSSMGCKELITKYINNEIEYDDIFKP